MVDDTQDNPLDRQCGQWLARRREQGLFRRPRLLDGPQGVRIRADGRELRHFASNDYLGLANDPAVIAAVKEAVERWGWGAGSSRLVVGNLAIHEQLQQRLARFKGTEAALVFPTGFQANLAIVTGLAGPDDVLFLDKLNHASIIDGARASGATLRVYPHNNLAKLEQLLARYPDARRRVIVTDSLFSMDGDFADLAGLVALKKRYGAILCIDEAHATGVIGAGGRGVAELLAVEDQIDVTVGTMSKALGGLGGFVAASRVFIDYLFNVARPLIYTTAIPPAACAAALAGLEIVDKQPHRRQKVLGLAQSLREGLARQGWNTGGSASQIIPLIVGNTDQATRLSARLEERGLLIPAIRPPTVPVGSARLRISLSANHRETDTQELLQVLAELTDEQG